MINMLIRDSKGRFAKGTIPVTFLNLDEKKILKLYCQDKISPQKIVKLFNCSITPIYQILNKNNAISKDVLLKARKEKPPYNKELFSEKEIKKIINLYQNERQSVEKIAKILQKGILPIYRILKENGVEIRHKKYNLDEQKVIEDYKVLGSSRKVAQKYHYNQKSILNILRKNNINYLEYIKPKPIKGLTLEEFYGEERGKKLRVKRKEHRSKQIFPLKDSSIEVKIQNFLKILHTEFATHYYISEINNKYRCDIFIPEQEGISQKTIIECDGCYWHGCRICNKQLNKHQKKQIKRDEQRTKDLLNKGYRVIRLLEHDINQIELNNFEKIIKNAIK